MALRPRPGAVAPHAGGARVPWQLGQHVRRARAHGAWKDLSGRLD